LPEALVGAFAVDRLFVFSRQGRRCQDLTALGLGQRPDSRSRRQHEAALDRSRPTLLIEKGHQGLAHSQFGDGDRRIKRRIGP